MTTDTEAERKKELEELRYDLYRLAIGQMIVDMVGVIHVQLHNIELFKDFAPGIEEALEDCKKPVQALVDSANVRLNENEHKMMSEYYAILEGKPDEDEDIKKARRMELEWPLAVARIDTRFLYARAAWVRDAGGMLEYLPYQAPKSFTKVEQESLKVISKRLLDMSHDMIDRGDKVWEKIDRALNRASLDDPREAD